MISRIMKNRVSYIPEIEKGFPVLTQKGIIYKSIPNITIFKCQITPLFRKRMIYQNYMTGDESSKSIIIHPTENFYQVVLKLSK